MKKEKAKTPAPTFLKKEMKDLLQIRLCKDNDFLEILYVVFYLLFILIMLV